MVQFVFCLPFVGLTSFQRSSYLGCSVINRGYLVACDFSLVFFVLLCVCQWWCEVVVLVSGLGF